MNRLLEQAGRWRKPALAARPDPGRPEPHPAAGRPGPHLADGGPRVRIALSSGQRKTEVRIQVSWRCGIPAAAVARLLIVFALVLAAVAVAVPGSDELTRGVLYSLAGFLTASRPRAGS
jgi:hypothetical protein